MAKDPSEFWYKGELGFFDNYIIPLAKKLKDCNVFGVSSDECLNYALQNRAEWQERGQEIVKEMHLELVGKYYNAEEVQNIHQSEIETEPVRELAETDRGESSNEPVAGKTTTMPQSKVEEAPIREEAETDHSEFFFL